MFIKTTKAKRVLFLSLRDVPIISSPMSEMGHTAVAHKLRRTVVWVIEAFTNTQYRRSLGDVIHHIYHY